jgi:hypothetical protein
MAIESGRLSFRETSNEFRRWLQYHISNKPSKISKGAFATFAGEDDPSTDDAPEKNLNQKKPKRETPNKRNKRQASRPLVAASLHALPICLACELIHKLANCYYAFLELAFSYFRLKDELAAQVKEKIANDTDLQEQLKKTEESSQKQLFEVDQGVRYFRSKHNRRMTIRTQNSRNAWEFCNPSRRLPTLCESRLYSIQPL